MAAYVHFAGIVFVKEHGGTKLVYCSKNEQENNPSLCNDSERDTADAVIVTGSNVRANFIFDEVPPRGGFHLPEDSIETEHDRLLKDFTCNKK